MNEYSLFDEFDPVLPSIEWRWRFADYPEKNGLKVFSTFACAGGSTMGYKLAGCDVIGCVEIDPKINNIYRANHHPKYSYCIDLRDFNKIEDLPDELFDLDILDGSPPCTTFSMTGDREETWDKMKKFREGQAEQTLDDLSFVFIDTVRKLRPKVMIMENVEGLLLGEAFSYVQRIYQELGAAGYVVHHWLCKGENMGIPQTRHRTFFVAIKASLGIDPSFLDMTFNYEPLPYSAIKMGEGPSINPRTEAYKLCGLAARPDRDFADVIIRNGLGDTRRRFNVKLCWPERVLPTLPAKLMHLRPDERQAISVEDIIHASTFPEDFDFGTQSYNQIAYVCGMSVPPVMMKRVVMKLINQGVFDYKIGEKK